MGASRQRSARRDRRPASAASLRDGLRIALLGTVPGRAMVLGAVAKLLVTAIPEGLAPLVRFVDAAANLIIGISAASFLFQLIAIAKRRLLWRVRRKLMLSYVFIGLIPALLIVSFFLLCGFLLFYNFSAYLVQSHLRALSAQARYIAERVASDIQHGGQREIGAVLSRSLAQTGSELGDVSMALVPVDRVCAQSAVPPTAFRPVDPVVAGPWPHVAPPTDVPGWIPCAGFGGLLAYSNASVTPGSGEVETHLLLRGVAFADEARPGYAVIVDVPVTDQIRQTLRRATGVEVQRVTLVTEAGGARPLAGRDEDARLDASAATEGPLTLRSLLEFRDWSTGSSGTLVMRTPLRIAELYARLSEAQGLIGRSFGQGLLLVLLVIGVLFLIIEFVAFVAGLMLARSITGSVHELFVGTERVRRGDFTHKIAMQADDQLGELAHSFNMMTASIEDLLRQSAEKKRLEEELRIAREIQMSLLPQGSLRMPGLSVTALCVPAREVGGDYYDFLKLDDHRAGVLIADVSGKGTSAALYMAELKGLVLSLSQIHASPRALLIAANRIIADNLDPRSFITMTYGIIDTTLGTMTYARAGHTPLIYLPGFGAAERRVQILAPDGMVLGLKLDRGEMFERLLEEQTIPLETGAVYLLFTDGITEAMNDRDEYFGEHRLAGLIEEHGHLPPDELRERVLREIEAFVGDAPQHDDMTLIMLKVEDDGMGHIDSGETLAHQLA